MSTFGGVRIKRLRVRWTNVILVLIAVCLIGTAFFLFFGPFSDDNGSKLADAQIIKSEDIVGSGSELEKVDPDDGISDEPTDKKGSESIDKNASSEKPTPELKIHKDVIAKIELAKIEYLGEKRSIRIIVDADDDKVDEVKANVEESGGSVEAEVGDTIIVDMPADSVLEFSSDDNVEGVYDDREYFILDAYQINADAAWELGYDGSGVKVAVLDTGISVFDVYSSEVFTGEDHVEDRQGHGTHIAGIVKQVAPSVSLLNGKVLTDSGTGSTSTIIQGIEWAITNGADVISMSIGGAYNDADSPLNKALQDAIDSGVVVVVSSGNCGEGCPSARCSGFIGVTTPGDYEDVITVGAVDSDNKWACFSSGQDFGSYVKPDMTAPGVDIISMSIDGGDAVMSGTSMSAPFVSGVAALLKEKDDSLGHYDVKTLLEEGALDLGAEGKDHKYGSGMVDVRKLFGVGVNVSLNESVNVSAYSVNESDDENNFSDYNKSFQFQIKPQINNINISKQVKLFEISYLQLDADNARSIKLAVSKPDKELILINLKSSYGKGWFGYLTETDQIGKYDYVVVAENEIGNASINGSFEVSYDIDYEGLIIRQDIDQYKYLSSYIDNSSYSNVLRTSCAKYNGSEQTIIAKVTAFPTIDSLNYFLDSSYPADFWNDTIEFRGKPIITNGNRVIWTSDNILVEIEGFASELVADYYLKYPNTFSPENFISNEYKMYSLNIEGMEELSGIHSMPTIFKTETSINQYNVNKTDVQKSEISAEDYGNYSTEDALCLSDAGCTDEWYCISGNVLVFNDKCYLGFCVKDEYYDCDDADDTYYECNGNYQDVYDFYCTGADGDAYCDYDTVHDYNCNNLNGISDVNYYCKGNEIWKSYWDNDYDCMEDDYQIWCGWDSSGSSYTEEHYSTCGSDQYCSNGNCYDYSISSAYWSKSSANEGDSVKMYVYSNFNSGRSINFAIYEDDDWSADEYETSKSDTTDSYGDGDASWTARWQSDEYGDPEYYFDVTIGSKTKRSGLMSVTRQCFDTDGDNYYKIGSCGGTDCDDSNNDIHPGASEICNGKDDDCDGYTDEGGVCSCSDCGLGITNLCNPSECLDLGDCYYTFDGLYYSCHDAPSNGHDDYCMYKTQHDLTCARNEYDCDYDSDCSSNNCAGDFIGLTCLGVECGCCNSNEEWDPDSNSCKKKDGEYCESDSDCMNICALGSNTCWNPDSCGSSQCKNWWLGECYDDDTIYYQDNSLYCDSGTNTICDSSQTCKHMGDYYCTYEDFWAWRKCASGCLVDSKTCACSVTDAYWDAPSFIVNDGQTLGLIAKGDKYCEDESVTFEIYEVDCGYDYQEYNAQDCTDEHVISYSKTIDNGVAKASWVSKWQDDGLLGGNPEYYFVAYNTYSPHIRSDTPDIEVKKCTSKNYTACYDDDLYWYNSCGVKEEKFDDCQDPSRECGTLDGKYGSLYNGYCDTQKNTCKYNQVEECSSCEAGQCVECGNGICESDESYESCPQDCTICGDGICQSAEECGVDCIKVLGFVNAPDKVYARQNVEISLKLKNIGDVTQVTDIETAIVPNSWAGTIVPMDIESQFAIILNPASCCPDNEYYDRKRVSITSGSDNETIVSFQIQAPSPSSYDHCGDMSAWSTNPDDFRLITGLFSECGDALSQYTKQDIKVQENNSVICTELDGSTPECSCDIGLCKEGQHCDLSIGYGACVPNLCDIPDGSSEDCECDRDEECPDGYICDIGLGDDACILGDAMVDQCKVGDFKCEGGDVFFCEDGQRSRWMLFDTCAYNEICDPDNINDIKQCSLDASYDLVIEDASSGVMVNKLVGDILNIKVWVEQQGSYRFDYNTDVFYLTGGTCGSGTFKQGYNYCSFIITGLGQYYFRLEDDVEVVNVIDKPKELYVTDKKQLNKRYSEDVNLILAKAYEKAAKNKGIVYDLDQYIDNHPFEKIFIDNYRENPISPYFKNNEYVYSMASFLKERCNGCEDIIIIGDDYVIPYYRQSYTLNENPDYYILTDTVHNTRKKDFTFQSIDYAFRTDTNSRGKNVKIILPTNFTSEQRGYLNDLKLVLNNRFNVTSQHIQEIQSNSMACDDFDIINTAVGTTTILIGTERNNRILRCFPSYTGADLEGAISIEPSIWSNEEYSFIIGSDEPRDIQGLAVIIGSGIYKSLPGREYFYLHKGLEVANYVIVPVSAFTGGTTIGAAMFWSLITLDTIDNCFIYPSENTVDRVVRCGLSASPFLFEAGAAVKRAIKVKQFLADGGEPVLKWIAENPGSTKVINKIPANKLDELREVIIDIVDKDTRKTFTSTLADASINPRLMESVDADGMLRAFADSVSNFNGESSIMKELALMMERDPVIAKEVMGIVGKSNKAWTDSQIRALSSFDSDILKGINSYVKKYDLDLYPERVNKIALVRSQNRVPDVIPGRLKFDGYLLASDGENVLKYRVNYLVDESTGVRYIIRRDNFIGWDGKLTSTGVQNFNDQLVTTMNFKLYDFDDLICSEGQLIEGFTIQTPFGVEDGSGFIRKIYDGDTLYDLFHHSGEASYYNWFTSDKEGVFYLTKVQKEALQREMPWNFVISQVDPNMNNYIRLSDGRIVAFDFADSLHIPGVDSPGLLEVEPTVEGMFRLADSTVNVEQRFINSFPQNRAMYERWKAAGEKMNSPVIDTMKKGIQERLAVLDIMEDMVNNMGELANDKMQIEASRFIYGLEDDGAVRKLSGKLFGSTTEEGRIMKFVKDFRKTKTDLQNQLNSLQ